jgi:UDP-N-acetylglucosamine 2-epimerase
MFPEDFLRLIYNSNCVVGNSSVAIRESSFLGVPAINIGNRQSGRERGANVIDVAYDRREITEAINQHLNNDRFPSTQLYGDGQAGKRIAELLSTQPLTVTKRLAY